MSYLLEGSVRRAGARVRITAQLIEAATGAHLWAERYDRSLDDIFAVQDEVAQTIVSTLVGRIEDARLQQSLRKPTTSLAAYDCLLRGLAHFRSDTETANQQALEMFEKAVALDPRYAVAHSYRRIGEGGAARSRLRTDRGAGRGVHRGKARARTRPAGEPLPPNTIDHLSLSS